LGEQQHARRAPHFMHAIPAAKRMYKDKFKIYSSSRLEFKPMTLPRVVQIVNVEMKIEKSLKLQLASGGICNDQLI
jgi:hypothetical protein